MPDLKKLITLEALQAALPSWLKSSSKPSYTADEISDTNTSNKFVTSADKSNWNAKGTYSKPTGGIPKSDLSQLVQNSLDLADSALQSESDPTVPSWAKQTNKPFYTQDEVTDGTTYKRVTSTEKSTWNNKQSALTTTQMQAVNSGITSEGVAQISTNQTNILYGINNTVKNICKVDVNTILSHNPGATASGNVVTKDNHIYFTISDGEITINSDGSNSQVILQLCNYDDFTLLDNTDYTLLGCSSGSNTKYDLRVSLAAASNVPQYTTPVTVSHATESDYNVSIVVRASQSLSNIKIKPMLCLKSIYDLDSSYQPYAASSDDLTRLESEDRAALAEEIDAGAKNKLDWASAQYLSNSNCTYSKTDTSLTASAGSSVSESKVFYSVGTFAAGNYVFKFKISSATISQQAYIYISTSTQPSTSIASIQITANGEYELPFSWSGGTVYLKFYPNTTNTSSSNTFTVSDIMICTKAAWKVSQKFVPYRPDLDLIYSSLKCDVKYAKVPVSTSYSLIGSIKTKGNRVCRITVTQEYASVAPTGLILSKSNQSSDFNTLTNRVAPPVETTTDDITLTISALCYYTYDRVVYIWAKAKTASANGNNFMALCEHFGDIDGVKNSMN